MNRARIHWEKLRKAPKLPPTAEFNDGHLKLIIIGDGISDPQFTVRALCSVYGRDSGYMEEMDQWDYHEGSYAESVRATAIQTMLDAAASYPEHAEHYTALKKQFTEKQTLKIGIPVEIDRIYWTELQRAWSVDNFKIHLRSNSSYKDAVYYFERIDVMKATTYIPSPNDVLLLRRKNNSTEKIHLRKGLSIISVPGVSSTPHLKNVFHCFERELGVIMLPIDILNYDLVMDDGRAYVEFLLKRFDAICEMKKTTEFGIYIIFTNVSEFAKKIATSRKKISFGRSEVCRTAPEFFDHFAKLILKRFKKHVTADFMRIESEDGSLTAKEAITFKRGVKSQLIRLQTSQLKL